MLICRQAGILAVPAEAVGRELDDAGGGQGIEAGQGADDAVQALGRAEAFVIEIQQIMHDLRVAIGDAQEE
ncbi:hypothetical protein ACIRVF_33780 [Kitasatospora sp. NPDC101157]|uniref:hypothetical protein n=1 Tax=Kitasatospora sp. NPDC101157 TaxID=3364098 RepID=UPI00381EED53